MKYKHKTIQSARHIVRGAVSAAHSMLNSTNWANEDAAQMVTEVDVALGNVRRAIHGRIGLSQEQQAERLAEARDTLAGVLRTLTKIGKKTESTYEANLVDDVHTVLTVAKQHLTASATTAKNRKSPSSKAAAPVVEPVTDAVDGDEDEDDEALDLF